MTNKISTKPYKGTRDFYPEDMQIRNYMFSVWREVCVNYGFEEYDFPVVEPLEIFAAKSGEELVNNQLFNFVDRAGRNITLRPELTPGTVRMLADRYNQLKKPVRWFMIGNNWRYERPQLGRGREFYQLEVNIFGAPDYYADVELLKIIVTVMERFGANPSQYTIKVSDRRIINSLLSVVLELNSEKQLATRRMMDKKEKLSETAFEKSLTDIGLNTKQIQKVIDFMNSDLETIKEVFPTKVLQENEGYLNLQNIFEKLEKLSITEQIQFDPGIIRGFDYSDGLVYEVFDNNPKNNRSLFGGERFDGLIKIFGKYDLPGTGFAMGDITLLEFLKGWDLLPDLEPEADYLVTVWPSENEEKYIEKSFSVSNTLRDLGYKTIMWLDSNTKIDKQLKFADQKNIPNILILGEEELANNKITLKNMATREQETKPLEQFISELE